MPLWGEVLVGIVIVVGLVGAVVQVYPGAMVVLVAVGTWGIVTGGSVGWTVTVLAALFTLAAMILKFVLAGRYLQRTGVPNRSLIIGGILAIIGFFVVPVVGLFLGFVLGVFLSELQRLGGADRAWPSTVHALKATGLTILIELAGARLATGAWVVGLFLVH